MQVFYTRNRGLGVDTSYLGTWTIRGCCQVAGLEQVQKLQVRLGSRRRRRQEPTRRGIHQGQSEAGRGLRTLFVELLPATLREVDVGLTLGPGHPALGSWALASWKDHMKSGQGMRRGSNVSGNPSQSVDKAQGALDVRATFCSSITYPFP